MGLGTAGIRCPLMPWVWSLQGYSAVGRCKNTVRLLLVTAGRLRSWALQDTLRLRAAGILCGWALRGYLVVARCRGTLRLGIAGILGVSVLPGYLVVGHCGDNLRLGTARIICVCALKGVLRDRELALDLLALQPQAHHRLAVQASGLRA